MCTDRGHERVVLAYVCGHGDAHVLETLVKSSKIPLIFDLDQTLLSAYTQSSLSAELKRIATEL